MRSNSDVYLALRNEHRKQLQALNLPFFDQQTKYQTAIIVQHRINCIIVNKVAGIIKLE